MLRAEAEAGDGQEDGTRGGGGGLEAEVSVVATEGGGEGGVDDGGEARMLGMAAGVGVGVGVGREVEVTHEGPVALALGGGEGQSRRCDSQHLGARAHLLHNHNRPQRPAVPRCTHYVGHQA